jgi:regulator of replication initiation timing
MKRMRSLLPRTEYKLLKNRKCARVSRHRRKKQTMSLIEINERLRVENRLLRLQIGMPNLAAENTIEFEPSEDDEKDSGGADTKKDSESLASSFSNRFRST